MNYINNIYKGKMVSCHVQALFNAYFKHKSYEEYLLLEALTTNAFGVKFIPNDPNRILDSFLDFDLGLDRALGLLNIDYRLKYFQKGDDSDKAIKVLKDWLKKDVVVIGPLNMEELEYLYNPQLYLGLDHYLIVLKYENNRFFFLDTEGFSLISSDIDTFVRAWSGDKVLEGRGKFMMRQVLQKKSIELNLDILKNVLSLVLENIQLSQKKNPYKVLSSLDLDKNQYLKNSLSYAIANRLQRIFIEKFFFNKIEFLSCKGIQNILNCQVKILSFIMNNILENKTLNMKKLYLLHDLEDKLMIEIEKIIKKI